MKSKKPSSESYLYHLLVCGQRDFYYFRFFFCTIGFTEIYLGYLSKFIGTHYDFNYVVSFLIAPHFHIHLMVTCFTLKDLHMNSFSSENMYLWGLSSLNVSDFILVKPHHISQCQRFPNNAFTSLFSSFIFTEILTFRMYFTFLSTDIY